MEFSTVLFNEDDCDKHFGVFEVETVEDYRKKKIAMMKECHILSSLIICLCYWNFVKKRMENEIREVEERMSKIIFFTGRESVYFEGDFLIQRGQGKYVLWYLPDIKVTNFPTFLHFLDEIVELYVEENIEKFKVLYFYSQIYNERLKQCTNFAEKYADHSFKHTIRDLTTNDLQTISTLVSRFKRDNPKSDVYIHAHYPNAPHFRIFHMHIVHSPYRKLDLVLMRRIIPLQMLLMNPSILHETFYLKVIPNNEIDCANSMQMEKHYPSKQQLLSLSVRDIQNNPKYKCSLPEVIFIMINENNNNSNNNNRNEISHIISSLDRCTITYAFEYYCEVGNFGISELIFEHGGVDENEYLLKEKVIFFTFFWGNQSFGTKLIEKNGYPLDFAFIGAICGGHMALLQEFLKSEEPLSFETLCLAKRVLGNRSENNEFHDLLYQQGVTWETFYSNQNFF